MFLRRTALLAAFSLLAGCSDSTGTVVIPGILTFTYSGGIAGTFSASGSYPSSQSAQETSSWAAGELSAPTGGVFVASATPRNASSHDFVDILIMRTTVGQETVNPNCVFNCTGMSVIFGAANGTGSTFLQMCYLEAGTLTITEVTSTRVKGTFSGTGTCMNAIGTQTAFTVTNGTFDLVLVPSLS